MKIQGQVRRDEMTARFREALDAAATAVLTLH
jgi:hypothetical protein